MMALFALFTLLLAAVGIVLMVKAFANFMPNNRRLDQDLQKMKADMDKWVEELVPLTDEELGLFSYNQEKQVMKKGLTKTARGIYTSIYHEPVVAYSYKEYLGSGRRALLYVRTAEHEFVYAVNKDGIRIGIDNKTVGTLRKDGILYGAKSKRKIAQINRDNPELLLPIIVNEKEVASVSNYRPDKGEKLGKRAFEFVREDMTQPEHEVFLSLGILEVIEQSINR
jgi:hypothetical protein